MVIAALPVVILFLVCQRYFVKGLADGIGKSSGIRLEQITGSNDPSDHHRKDNAC